MKLFKTLTDPLGNIIQFPMQLTYSPNNSCEQITEVVTSPSFLINEKNRKLYFFRLIGTGINMLVEAQLKKDHFEVRSCVQNPTTEYISRLLRKGALFSFNV